jgi:4-amino-4-deoxy-L-arabinose transferase-like glycosyltransferase
MTTLVSPDRDLTGPRPPAASRPSRARRWWRGRPDDPVWVRPAVLALLAGTAVLYLWNLGASGWANSFYAAAVQAGTKSWKAFFFGSSDASNFITVDKPPASLWVMELSARLFGLNSWSLLVPQALEGVAAVGILYVTVRRWFSAGTALLAGAVLALTPVAALMFRFNNPDALLVLLLVAAAWAAVRAVDDGRTGWLVLAGTLVGFGFITKMLQAFLVVPAIAGVYLLAGPTPLRRRVGQLAAGGLAMVVSAGWWVVAVQLTPAADRPYIGGSQDNSLWNLIFGYNGFGRLTGNETGSVGGGGGRAGVWGPTGWTRLFNSQFGGQISWLLPAALVLAAAALWWTRRASRRDRTRAATVLWGGWLVVTGAVFSFGKGIIHPYYTVALAPAIAALVAVGSNVAWQRRASLTGRTVMAGALVATAVWAAVLLDRTPQWHPGLRPTILAIGFACAAALMAGRWLPRRIGVAAAAVAVVVALTGPAAYALETVSTPQSGAIVSAGPTVPGGGVGGGPPGGGGPAAGGFRGGAPPGAAGPTGGSFAAGPLGPSTGAGAGAGAAFPGPFGASGSATGRPTGGGAGGPGGGAAGGLLNGSKPNAALTATLKADAGRYTWVAAAVGSESASGYQLASGEPVMSIGGFNGTDPAPTLAQFERWVSDKKIHYFIAGGAGGGGAFGGSSASSSSAITTWVEQHFTATTVGGVTLYDLTSPSGATTSSSSTIVA